MSTITLKDREYYETNKRMVCGKYNERWKSISGRRYVGNCSLLYRKLNPTSYQDFFDKYVSYIAPDDQTYGESIRRNPKYGRSVNDLTRLAEYYKRICRDETIPLENFLDDVICHTIIETFDGHQAERELKHILLEKGFNVNETEGDLDAKLGVDLVVRGKNGMVQNLIQVKPISTFLGNNNQSLIKDRKNFFTKQEDLNRQLGTVKEIVYMLYDSNHLRKYREVLWYYKGDKVRFRLDELVDRNGIVSNILSDFTAKKLVLK